VRERGRAGLTLVELLVVIAIGSVVTGALLLTWFSLGKSYSMTTKSTQSREFARDAVARLARELRDAEPSGTYPALRSVGVDEIVFTTTFNDAANEQANSEPLLTRYWYEWDAAAGSGVLYRQRDSRTSGRVGYLDLEDGTRDPADRVMVIVRDVLNPRDEATGRATIFTYSYVDTDKDVVRDGSPPDAVSLPTTFMVRITLSIDLNPESAPSPMDLSTSVQLRNQGRY
jgi:prepilin-type N-terminal cleavage/methylation domain-containing protein